MEFQYRGHTTTVTDKIVEYFTSFVDPTVTELLFDTYLEGAIGKGQVDIEDIDLGLFSDEELSKTIGSYMLDECKVTLEIKGLWDKEWPKIEEEENSQY